MFPYTLTPSIIASEMHLAPLSCLGLGIIVPTSRSMYETRVTHTSSKDNHPHHASPLWFVLSVLDRRVFKNYYSLEHIVQ